MYVINDMIAKTSQHLDEAGKHWMLEGSNDSKRRLQNYKTEHIEYFNATSIQGEVTLFLTFWNEAVGIDIERFWKEVSLQNIEFKRVEPLRYALKNGHFRNTHVVISARNQWNELLNSSYIKENYTEQEIQRLQTIMQKDEEERTKIIKKCIKNKTINIGISLKLYDTLEYFDRYDLMSKHFSQVDINEFNKIKQDFEIRLTTNATRQQGSIN